MATSKENSGKQGFASMDKDKQRGIASQGGKASHGGQDSSSKSSASSASNSGNSASKTGGTQGGSHEQHVKAGQQSHKNSK